MWTIRKIDSANWVAIDKSNDVVARMVLSPGRDVCAVRFVKTRAFDYDFGNGVMAEPLERAIGYVRGIERAVDVHARETVRL